MNNQIRSDMIFICLKATLIKTPGLKLRDGDMLENKNVKMDYILVFEITQMFLLLQ